MIKQLIVTRKSRTYDNGEMGFSDYVTEYEGFSDFVDRVTKKANELKNVISISYPNMKVAIIVYKEVWNYWKGMINFGFTSVERHS